MPSPTAWQKSDAISRPALAGCHGDELCSCRQRLKRLNGADKLLGVKALSGLIGKSSPVPTNVRTIAHCSPPLFELHLLCTIYHRLQRIVALETCFKSPAIYQHLVLAVLG